MVIPPMLLKWLQENLNRLFKKSPKFFMAWNIMTMAMMGITFVPEIFSWFDVELPTLFASKINKAVGWASTGFFLASQLSTSSTAVGKTEDGAMLKTTDEKKLPFTAAVEQKQEEKAVEKLPEVPSGMINKN